MKDLSDDQNADQLISAEQAAKAAQELDDVKQKLEKERLANEEKLHKERDGRSGKSKAAISLPFNLHCKAIAALFFRARQLLVCHSIYIVKQ